MEYQPILKLKENGKAKPLFLVHPAGAGAEVYKDMAELFGDSQAVYGIESYNLNHLDNPIGSLELLAKQYIAYIKQIQPEGPYFLGGWSLGGTIAYVMSQYLIRQGEKVASVYLLDSKGLTPEKWEEMERLVDEGVFTQYMKLAEIADEAIEKLLKLQLIESQLLRTHYLGELGEVDVILMEAINPGNVIDPSFERVLDTLFKLSKLPQSGWSQYAKNLTVHQFDADHQSIMKGNHLGRIVEIMKADINHKKDKV